MKLTLKDRITSPYFMAYFLIAVILVVSFWLTDSPRGEGWKVLIMLFYIPTGSIIAHKLTKERVQHKREE